MIGQDPMGAEPRTHEEHFIAVGNFALSMVEKLDANAAKEHWRNLPTEFLLRRLHDELIELRNAVAGGDPARIRDEARDVANMAMMIFDNWGRIVVPTDG